ncbi:CoA-binding protein [Candidatus Micrarchaeota archaeon]|nr:CoA-binding protein [Candidatus Micrarchaeota archaeon]
MPSIAIIGASYDRNKFGNKAVRAYNHRGWTVFPVSLKESSIEHIPAYHSVLDIDSVPNYASLYIPPAAVLDVLGQIAKKGIRLVYFNPGTESPAALEKARDLGLEPIVACSIRAIGVDPDTL